MEMITSIANTIISSISTILNLIKKAFGKVELSTFLGFICLGRQPVDDGFGGQKGGSILQFELLIKNNKPCPIIIDSIYCQAYCGEKVIVDQWECQDNDRYITSAHARHYSTIRTIDVDSNKSRSLNIRLISNSDLSSCNAIVLRCKIGKKTKKIDVWKNC